MDQYAPIPQPAALFTTLIAVLLCFMYMKVTAPRRLPYSIPWVGCREELFSRTRAHFREIALGGEFLKEGYEKFSKGGLPFASPNVTFHPEVLLPPELMTWLLRQPESVASVQEMQKHVLVTDYVLQASHLDSNLHITIVRHDLTRNIGRLLPTLTREIRNSISNAWGEDGKEWSEKDVTQSMTAIVKQVSCRTLFGEELSQNADFVNLMGKHAVSWSLTAFAIRVLVPDLLKPVLAPMIAFYTRTYLARKIKHHLNPVIKKRMRLFQDSPSEHQPEDVLQYLIAPKSTSLPAPSQDEIITILLLLNFAAYHTTILTSTSALYSILSHQPAPETPHLWTLLHDEALSALTLTDTQTTSSPTIPAPTSELTEWTRPLLTHSLPLTTSTIREALRYAPLGGRAMMHQVMSPTGLDLTIPNPGGSSNNNNTQTKYHFAPGARIGMPAGLIQLDAANYDRPEDFDPWRFVGPSGVGSGSGPGPDIALTSPTYLPFSHGRHACPGRFFASAVLKMLVAELALRYEVKPLEERPKDIRVSDAVVPNQTAKVWVRKRV